MDGINGDGGIRRGTEVRSAPPDAIRELAENCVRFVEKAVGLKLDYEAETLPLLDHYVEQARRESVGRPEALPLLACTIGAYFGEVVRRRYASWWRIDDVVADDDPTFWQIEFEQVYLAFCPVQFIRDALVHGAAESENAPPAPQDASEDDTTDEGAADSPGATSGLELSDEDTDAVSARLAELPPVSLAEFYAPSTRLEVIDIVVDAIRSRRMADGEGDAVLVPDDYVTEH